jgi:CHASE3 domain sensor protein
VADSDGARVAEGICSPATQTRSTEDEASEAEAHQQERAIVNEQRVEIVLYVIMGLIVIWTVTVLIVLIRAYPGE